MAAHRFEAVLQLEGRMATFVEVRDARREQEAS
jgi:hypothetical protein